MTALAGVATQARPAETIETLEAGFADAARRRGVIEQVIGVAGCRIGLRFAGEDVAGWVAPAFAHLQAEADGSPPDLTICVWQADRPGVDLLPGVHRNRDATFAAHSFGGITSAVHVGTGRGYCCVAGLDAVRSWDRAAPMSAMLKCWLASRGLHLTHGAAVGRNGSGVLLTGRGGSGKSTTALACLRGGLDHAGDDWVVVQTDPVMVHSLYAAAKLVVGHWSANKNLLPGASVEPGDEKCLGFLDSERPLGAAGGRFVRHLKLRAVLLPIVTGRPDTRVVPCTPGQALLALAPATMFELRGDDAAAFAASSALVRRLPCFALELGTRLDRIPDHIDSLLASLALEGR